MALALAWHKKRSNPLPPSPVLYPVIGHLLSVPTQDEYLAFTKIGRQLNSGIFSLSVPGTNIVVLNSLEHATNLLEKRSAIYSDRASQPMLAEPSLMNWGTFVPMERYNDRWRTHRRLMHLMLNKKSIEHVAPAQEFTARRLLQCLWRQSESPIDSEHLYEEIHMNMASALAKIVYSREIMSHDDPFHVGARELAENVITALTPSNFWVNLFPAMIYLPDWLPGTDWKRTARKWGEEKDCWIDAAYTQSRSRVVMGEDHDSIVALMLKQAKSLGLETNEADEYIKDTAFALLGGG
ncbi:hypothetical protein FRC12_012385 [Ceratobasidium sp. 428]|nr:hypothetical protein FRC12_012385 [Ceratobasidium sp. 428]